MSICLLLIYIHVYLFTFSVCGVNVYTDDSLPGTPTSPTGSHASMAMSIGSGNTVPIARTDKHVVLAMSPARPKVSSMQAKLDHTKIDTSLYEQVNTKPKAIKPFILFRVAEQMSI